jgi:hypothetical protein
MTASPAPGLCESCAHGHRIRSGKGAVFWRCTRGLTDPTYPKYPRLPVLSCRGFEPREPPDDEGDAADGDP